MYSATLRPSGTLTINAGAALNVSGTLGDSMVIGRDGGSGTLTQNGGTFDFSLTNGFLFVGASANPTTVAAYNMNGGDAEHARPDFIRRLRRQRRRRSRHAQCRNGSRRFPTSPIYCCPGERRRSRQSVGRVGERDRPSADRLLDVQPDNGAVGTYNLDGGTLQTPAIVKTITAAGGSILNLNGGTLRSGGTGTLISGIDHAYIKNGGAIFDTQNFTSTVSQALNKA